FDSAIVAVVNEAVLEIPVITESVAGLQAIFRGPGADGAFHAVHVGRGHDLDAVDLAAVEIELHVGRHVARGCIDGARRAIDDVPVGEGSFAIIVVERDGIGRRQEVSGGLHTDGREEILLHVVFKALPSDLLNDVGGDCGASVAVGHAGAGTPAGDARRLTVGKGGAQIHAVGIFGVFAE